MDSRNLDRASDPDGESHAHQASDSDRRDFLATFSTIAMAGGLAAGYGTFAALAVRYVFPANVETPWLYVAPAAEIGSGGSRVFESPAGVRVTIARRTDGGDTADPAAQFIALSSVCPHLGCRVHWEPHNKRFFCPCHNGVFDPEGRPVSGPPKSAEQELSRYPLKVEGGLLYIAINTRTVGDSAAQRRQLASRADKPSEREQGTLS